MVTYATIQNTDPKHAERLILKIVPSSDVSDILSKFTAVLEPVPADNDTDSGQIFLSDKLIAAGSVNIGKELYDTPITLYQTHTNSFLSTNGQTSPQATPNSREESVGGIVFLTPQEVDSFFVTGINAFGFCYIYKK